MPARCINKPKACTSAIVRWMYESDSVINIILHDKVVVQLTPVRVIATPAEQLDSLWAEMDRLAEEITIKWTGSHSALEAVREGRR